MPHVTFRAPSGPVRPATARSAAPGLVRPTARDAAPRLARPTARDAVGQVSRALSALLGVVLAVLLSPGAAQAASLAAPQGRVALVGVPGLEWSDLDPTRTPHLWRLVSEGGSASLSTRAVPPPDRGITCPMSGWLTVSAGQRAGTPGKGCPAIPDPRPDGEGATVPGWAELAAHQPETGYDAQLGALGQLVADAGGKVAAIGPGAALAAADKAGNIARYVHNPESLPDLTPYHLIVLDVPELATAWAGRPLDEYGVPASMPAAARKAAVAEADRRIGALLTRLPAGTTVLVAGVSDVTPNAHLHVALATGPSPEGGTYGHGHLTAMSTRQDALVTITDLTATAIAALGLDAPREVVGRPWRSDGPAPATPAETVEELADGDLASQVLREVRGPFFAVFVTVQLLFYVFAALALRRRRDSASSPVQETASTSRLLATVQVVAVVSGSVAVSTFLAQLVPWWSLPAPMLALIVTILVIAGLISALAFAGPWRGHVLGPLTVVAGVTSVALLLDVMTGSTLQVNAVTGYEPVTGGRFYGFSNIAFAVYATGTILGLAGLAQWLLGRGTTRLVVVLACGAYGALAIFADGWPSWGADFGGVPAFVIGFAVFLIMLYGRRVSLVKLLLVALAGIVLIGGIAVFDWLRPVTQRTHLGNFVQQIIDGQAWTVITRKFGAMIGVTVGNWSLTLLSLVAIAFLFLVLDRPSRWGASALGQAYAAAPSLRAGLLGALTCAFVGFLINDSGIAIPAMALTVAVPLALAASVRALRLAKPTTPGQPSAPTATTEQPEP
ncbi:hypothetical protein [Nonomuraea cavernae]|uniref:Uncharacterized protein n=1 Tax=Nonomuraea cavernae TaxID=2045107 RepID=A0A917Z862_9ACTN|nr:hypothetical protein [Nonomuraea cavernae]MCA2189878.1 hypothetical protein [Nonomuraea cavernae]GGO77762.1 hypothetical protein GCM10012289_58180 [Nonomuraea cavernae]